MSDLGEIGCTDGGCVFRVAPGGVGTNGGCQCVPRHITGPHHRAVIDGWVRTLRNAVIVRDGRIAELEAAVARLSARPTVADHKATVASRDHWEAEYTRQLLLASTYKAGAEKALARQAELEAELKGAEFSRDFAARRCELLQQWQSRMRDPERQIVCDILANGLTLPDPDGSRYGAPKA